MYIDKFKFTIFAINLQSVLDDIGNIRRDFSEFTRRVNVLRIVLDIRVIRITIAFAIFNSSIVV